MSRALPALALFLLLPLAALACEATLDETLTDLQEGDCVLHPGDGQSEVDSLETVGCDDADAIEVVEVFEMDGFSEWPGLGEIQNQAIENCPTTTSFTLYPTEQSWDDAGDRSIVCFE